jgi:imidazolonepropionase-like amidohydrolase
MRRELAALALAALATAAPAADLVVRAGRAFDGERFVDAPVTLVARDGKLVARARKLVAGDGKQGALAIDATKLVVVPGFVDLRSGAGLPPWGANDESTEDAASWRAVDAVDPHSLAMRRALESGVTTAVVSPGGRGVIGGLAGAVKTDDRPLDRRIVKADAALVVALGFEPALGNRSARYQQPYGLHFRRPGNRMGTVAEVRKAVFVARDGASGDEAATMRRALGGEIPTWMIARTDADVRTAMQLGQEMGVKPVLLEPFEAHRRADELAAAGIAAIVGPEYEIPRALMEQFEGQDARASTAAILQAAGVTVALATGLADAPDALRDRAILAARNGMPKERALAAITSVPARLLGLGDRLGTLRPGADADLVLLDGDPLAASSRVVAVIVEGRLAWHDASVQEPEPTR